MKKQNVLNKLIKGLGISIVAATVFTGCNKTNFASVAEPLSSKSDIPVDEEGPISVPVVVAPSFGFKLSNGLCNADSSTQLLACSTCIVPQIQLQPQLSKKAQALLDVMVLACGVANKSDLTNVRPSREMILNKLNQATERNYPESFRSSNTEILIQGLTNSSDGSLRQKMFGGLWYQPPFSNTFEQYFGITVNEAKSTFCWYGDKMDGVVSNKTGLFSIEWLNCQYESGSPGSCVEKPGYVAGKVYRQQLEKSLELGLSNPYTAPIPDPQKTCAWDKFEGDDLVAAKIQLRKWRAEGRKVSMQLKKNGIGQCGDAQESALTEGSSVEMATYRCQ